MKTFLYQLSLINSFFKRSINYFRIYVGTLKINQDLFYYFRILLIIKDNTLKSEKSLK